MVSGIETKVVTSIIKNNKVNDFSKSGFVAEDFYEHSDKIRWILDSSQKGYTVTESMFNEEFPNFTYSEEVLDYEYIVDKFFEDYYAKITSRKILTAPVTKMSEWIPSVIQGLSDILQKKEGSSILSFKSVGNRFSSHTERGSREYYNINIPIIDEALGGIAKGVNFAVVAPQKTGKTWLMCYVAQVLREQGAKVLFITKEITDEAMRNRLDAMRFDLDYRKLRSGRLEEEDLQRWRHEVEEIKEEKGDILIVYERSHTLSAIPAYIKEYKPDVVLIDGAYLWAKTYDWKEVAQVTKTIARWSKDFGIVIGYSWQSNAVETDDLKKTQIAFGKLGLLSDVDFALGANRTPEMKERNLMAISILTSRDSDDANRGFIGWTFCDNSYPQITAVSAEFSLEDIVDPESIIFEL